MSVDEHIMMYLHPATAETSAFPGDRSSDSPILSPINRENRENKKSLILNRNYEPLHTPRKNHSNKK